MIFDRKDKAFREFERRMMAPPPPPPVARNAPALWVRARDMFAAVVRQARTLAGLAVRPKLRRPERREILKRLIPAETLTRFLLTIEAVAFLLMTPAGARLRRAIRLAPAHAKASMAASRRMTAPGAHAIAGTRPATDPRSAATEDHQRGDAAAAHDPAHAPANDDEDDDDDGFMEVGLAAADPARWICRFRATPDFSPYTDDNAYVPAPRRVRIEDPAAERPVPPLRSAPPARSLAPAPDVDSPLGPGAALARRIEALSRVLANPDAAIRRLARRLAALPLEELWPPESAWLADQWWLPARRDLLNAAELFCCALIALYRTLAGPPPEPG